MSVSRCPYRKDTQMSCMNNQMIHIWYLDTLFFTFFSHETFFFPIHLLTTMFHDSCFTRDFIPHDPFLYNSFFHMILTWFIYYLFDIFSCLFPPDIQTINFCHVFFFHNSSLFTFDSLQNSFILPKFIDFFFTQ